MVHNQYTPNILLAFRHLSVGLSDHMPLFTAVTFLPQALLSLAKQEQWFTFWCVSLHMCTCMSCTTTMIHQSVICCWAVLSSVLITTLTHTNSIATQTTAVMAVCVLTEVKDYDALTAFPQPSLNLCCSSVTLTTMAVACEPARLPRTQRWLSEPLTSEAATKRPETSRLGSSVNRLDTQLFSI